MLGSATIILFRSFTLFSDSYNPDEGMHLANAIAMDADFRPWGATDFTTFGPVNAVLIILLVKIITIFLPQAGYTYFSLRLLNIILLVMSFIIFEKCLCKSINKIVSRAVSMLFVIFYAFHFNPEILAFNAEITYIFFATAALYLLYQIDYGIKSRNLLTFGIVCGTMPYIKLQTAPMCAALALGSIYMVVRATIPMDKEKNGYYIKIFAALLSGITLPTIILCAYLLTFKNGFTDAWFYYIENAKSHIGNPGLTQYLSQFVKLLDCFSNDALKICFFVTVTLFILVVFLKIRITYKFLFSGLFLAATAFGVVRSFHLFYHYVNFLVVPVLLFLAETAQMFLDNEKCFGEIHIKTIVLVVLFLCSIRQFEIFYEELSTNTIFSSKQVVGESNPNLTEVALFVLNNTTPNDSIVVWGWESRVYVYANRRPATRQTDIQRLFPPYDEQNIDMYISDIRNNQPEYIVDIVAPGSFAYEDADIYALEKHKTVWNALKEHYALVQTMPVDGGSYKIYERNAQLKD